jgi:hypothetical protein
MSRTRVDDHITCWKKVLYKLLIDAELDCARLWAYNKRDTIPYKCPVCPFWHIANQKWAVDRINGLYKIQNKMMTQGGQDDNRSDTTGNDDSDQLQSNAGADETGMQE